MTHLSPAGPPQHRAPLCLSQSFGTTVWQISTETMPCHGSTQLLQAPRHLNRSSPSLYLLLPPALTWDPAKQFHLEPCVGKADTKCKSESNATILWPKEGRQEAKSCVRQPGCGHFPAEGGVLFLLTLFYFDPGPVFQGNTGL